MNDAQQLARDPSQETSLETILSELMRVRSAVTAESDKYKTALIAVHPNFRESAENLLHYLALRRRDLRPLQHQLAVRGLSSLGRAESHVLSNIDAVLDVVRSLLNRPRPDSGDPVPVDYLRGRQLLSEHTEELLGPSTPGRSVRIMVTLPSEAAHDYALIHNLLLEGMDCARINCAHDDPQVWARMIEHVKRGERALGQPCRIVMDLAGPKLRTGPLVPGPRVLKIKPKRDVFGNVSLTARVWLVPESALTAPPTPADAIIPVRADTLERLRPGDSITFRDARRAKRSMDIVDVTVDGVWAELRATAYVVPGTVLHHHPYHHKGHSAKYVVADLPALESFIKLRIGDHLVITRSAEPGREATFDSSGRVLTPATIGCTIPDVFDDVQAGEPVWFDDGKIGGVVEKIDSDRVLARITHAKPTGTKLRADKGINLPESSLDLPALAAKDIEDLSFVCRHADVVELSFANAVSDVEELQRQIAKCPGRAPSIVLKIETHRGFRSLPEMLLAAMRSQCCGIMIARGDLAVECGFERLAEVQEEILWICEAAHVPVIWATQVLESLAKGGMPSRAEITDAAMGDRAECVMLNKGPHVLEAVRSLDDILRRMQAHQAKKSSMLRELSLAHSVPL